MKRKARVILAGVGAAAGIYGLTRLLGGKHIKRLPSGYGIKIKKAVTVNAPAGRLYAWKLARSPRQTEGGKTAHWDQTVDTASEDSFPASDAPSWTGTTGPLRCRLAPPASLTHHDHPLANVMAVQLPDSIRNRNFFRNICVRKTGRRS